jgi:hypothetical protein
MTRYGDCVFFLPGKDQERECHFLIGKEGYCDVRDCEVRR